MNVTYHQRPLPAPYIEGLARQDTSNNAESFMISIENGSALSVSEP